MKIIQIVPHRRLAPDGVGDYAVQLAKRLKARGLETIFVAGNLTEQPATDGWPTIYVPEQTATGLLKALKQAAAGTDPHVVLFHIVGYGYAKRGVPFWLLQGWKAWQAQNRKERAIGIFHELYGSGPVTTSSFWLSPLQKFITRSLWLTLEAAVTTTPSYVADLARWRPVAKSRIVEMPVPSNVGEPEKIPGIEARAKRAAVFGRPGMEAPLYGQFLKQVEGTLAALDIEELIDIGVRYRPPPPSIGTIPVRALGHLSAERVSEEFLNCRVGLLAYDCARLGKSTIFSGYAAHGVVPICFDMPTKERASRVPGYYLDSGCASAAQQDLKSLQDRLVDDYQRHNLDALTAVIAGIILQKATVGL